MFDGASSPPDAPNLPTYPVDAGVRPESNACSGGKGEDPDAETVGDHLTANAAFADADWDLEKAADAMARGGFRHLVVISGGDVQGIISMRDIMAVWRPSAREGE